MVEMITAEQEARAYLSSRNCWAEDVIDPEVQAVSKVRLRPAAGG